MAGSPEKAARRERLKALKADPEFLDTLLQGISQGVALSRLCAEYDVPFQRVSEWLYADDERARKYARARELRAQTFVNSIEQITRDVQDEDGIDPKRAKVATDNLRWLAARHDPHLWGDKTQHTHTHQGAVELHLQAVRQLSTLPAASGATYPHDAPRSLDAQNADDEEDRPGYDLL